MSHVQKPPGFLSVSMRYTHWDLKAERIELAKQEGERRAVEGDVVPGILSQMLNLPIELLLRIAYFLSPRDLFRICDVYVPFETLFMNNSTTIDKLWEVVMLNAGVLPERPATFATRTYALLLFGTRCMVSHRLSSIHELG